MFKGQNICLYLGTQNLYVRQDAGYEGTDNYEPINPGDFAWKFFSVIQYMMIQDTALLRLAEFGQEEISTILLQMWTLSWTAGRSAARNLHALASLICGSQLWSLKGAALSRAP